MEIQDGSTLLKRPTELEADVVRFQNQKDKWIAFVGLKDGRPYEIFTGLADDEMGIALPKSVTKGKIIKVVQEDGSKRYDFQFVNTRGFKLCPFDLRRTPLRHADRSGGSYDQWSADGQRFDQQLDDGCSTCIKKIHPRRCGRG